VDAELLGAFVPIEVWVFAPSPALGAAFYACQGFSFFYGNKTGLREREKPRYATGLFPGCCVTGDRLAASTSAEAKDGGISRPYKCPNKVGGGIGRRAPVKRCLARKSNYEIRKRRNSKKERPKTA